MALLPFSSRTDTAIHRCPAGIKLGIALLLIIGNLMCPPRWAWLLAIPALLAIIAAIMARLSFRQILVRLLILEPMVAGVATLALMQPNGTEKFIWLICRSTSSLLVMIVMASTTSPVGIIHFLKQCHVPALLVTTLLLMCSYMAIIAEESQRMMRARKCRTYTTQRLWQWRTLAMLIGQLFIRASERAERVYGAMASRGWQ